MSVVPPPVTTRPVPRGRPVESHALPPWGLPVLRRFPCADMPSPLTPVGPLEGSGCSPDTSDGGLPPDSAGSAPTLDFPKPGRYRLDIRSDDELDADLTPGVWEEIDVVQLRGGTSNTS